MEDQTIYRVEIAPDAEQDYWDILKHFYEYHSDEGAEKKEEELMAKAISLKSHPYRGKVEERLAFLGKGHRFLLYSYTKNRSIKIIYFIEEQTKTVYITNFFPTKMEKFS